MLNVSKKEREVLLASDAIDITQDGDEVLRGLTVAETQFLLAVAKSEEQNVGAAESHTYQQLRQRHAKAVASFGTNVEAYLRTVCGTANIIREKVIVRRLLGTSLHPQYLSCPPEVPHRNP
ncbi:MAG: hypothetical protein ABW069_18050 [Duganella sp.]